MLAVMITPTACDGVPVAIAWMRSEKFGVRVLAKVRSPLISDQLPPVEVGPGGTPWLVESHTVFVPANKRLLFAGSRKKGVAKAVGSPQAGSLPFDAKRQGAASTKPSSGALGSAGLNVVLPLANPRLELSAIRVVPAMAV